MHAYLSITEVPGDVSSGCNVGETQNTLLPCSAWIRILSMSFSVVEAGLTNVLTGRFDFGLLYKLETL